MAAAALCVLGSLFAFASAPALAGSGLTLPDGRAWELVSPPDKHGAPIESPLPHDGGAVQASEDGSAIAYETTGPIVTDPEGNRSPELAEVFSSRGPGGWSSQDIATPHETMVPLFIGFGQEYHLFSSDLSLAVVEPRGLAPLLGPKAAKQTEQTVYLRNDECGSAEQCEEAGSQLYLPLVTAANVPAGAKIAGEQRSAFVFTGATPDLSHLVLSNGDLWEWTGGQLQLVNVLPKSTIAATNAALGSHTVVVRHAISNQGSRIVWSTESGSEGHLYMRDMTRMETVQLDAVQNGSGSGQPRPRFQTASSDGSKVFFTDSQRLTADSTASETASNGEPDLYVFEVTSGSGEPLAGKLTDLTVDTTTEPADVLGGAIPGASEDGSYVYFVANGALAPETAPGNCMSSSPPPGATCNLYVRHYDRETKVWEPPVFIAALSNEDGPDWANTTNQLGGVTSRVSPNGRYLAFMSDRSLTGYDNRDVISGERDEEVFLYDVTRPVSAGKPGTPDNPGCVSCNPTGARPEGVFDSGEGTGLLVDRPNTWSKRWLAGSIPGWTKMELDRALYQSRYLSDSGRLFFTSSDALVAQDVNSREDVYEYEPDGLGTCHLSGGCVALISSGISSEESAFLDASGRGPGGEEGEDVFFLTLSRLVPQDHDTALDVYDAHVCSPAAPCFSSPVESPPCSTADSCRAAPSPQPAIFGAPASATFSGIGNAVAPAGKPAVKSRRLTAAQKLATALRACGKKPKRKRTACKRQARRRYAAKKSNARGRSSVRVGR